MTWTGGAWSCLILPTAAGTFEVRVLAPGWVVGSSARLIVLPVPVARPVFDVSRAGLATLAAAQRAAALALQDAGASAWAPGNPRTSPLVLSYVAAVCGVTTATGNDVVRVAEVAAVAPVLRAGTTVAQLLRVVFSYSPSPDAIITALSKIRGLPACEIPHVAEPGGGGRVGGEYHAGREGTDVAGGGGARDDGDSGGCGGGSGVSGDFDADVRIDCVVYRQRNRSDVLVMGDDGSLADTPAPALRRSVASQAELSRHTVLAATAPLQRSFSGHHGRVRPPMSRKKWRLQRGLLVMLQWLLAAKGA